MHTQPRRPVDGGSPQERICHIDYSENDQSENKDPIVNLREDVENVHVMCDTHVDGKYIQSLIDSGNTYRLSGSENLMKILSLTEQDLVPLDLNYIGSANRKSNLTVMGRTKEAVTIKLPNIKTVFKAHITFLKVMFKKISQLLCKYTHKKVKVYVCTSTY